MITEWGEKGGWDEMEEGNIFLSFSQIIIIIITKLTFLSGFVHPHSSRIISYLFLFAENYNIGWLRGAGGTVLQRLQIPA